jgi:hypothetical protein
MRSIKTFLTACLLFCQSSGFACLNLYVINERGEESYYDAYRPFDIRISPKETLQSLETYAKWIKEGQGKEQHRYISNYAVYLIRLGRHKEALPILRTLAQSKPGEYEILANLGTAYELNDYPDSALLYMKQSLVINPHSHGDSEWFHVRLLEAAIKIKRGEAIADTLNILKIDTAMSNLIGYQIGEQLSERLPLSSAPNPLLAKAIEECADYFRRVISVDWSIKFYAIAAGYSDNDANRQRLWTKIESARARVFELASKKRGTSFNYKDYTRKELLGKNWQQVIRKDIDQWSRFKAHYEANLEILNL